jgi:murein DD-endopeptidase MepM/ murein hydrolase activator NlpD
LSYGFVFTGKDACVPVVFGTGVVAAAGGEVIKADRDYKPQSPAAFQRLIQSVKNGADLAAMDALRGREVWIRHPDGRVSVYAHLSKIAPHVRVGARIARGDWIGNVGNSGTSYEVRGTKDGARLLFELWEGRVQEGRYFGQGQSPEEVRKAARAFFKNLPETP